MFVHIDIEDGVSLPCWMGVKQEGITGPISTARDKAKRLYKTADSKVFIWRRKGLLSLSSLHMIMW